MTLLISKGSKQPAQLFRMLNVLTRVTAAGITVRMDTLYKTIENEVTEPLEGKVTKGQVPEWINGSLYRNGPGMYEVGEQKYKHWFDGLAMLQKFHISNGSVSYVRKYLRSKTYTECMEKGKIVHHHFATAPDPCQNIFGRFLTVFEPHKYSDNTLVNVVPVKDDLYTITETKFMNKIDPETLDLLETVDLEKHMKTTLATPHPHIDEDGTMHNLGHNFDRGMFTVLTRIPPKTDKDAKLPKGEMVCKLSTPGAIHIAYYHSFGITENYYVFVEQPLLSNIPVYLATRSFGKPFYWSLKFHPEMKTRFRIVDRSTGKELNTEIKYQTDPFLLFHHINAYEKDGHIVLDLCCHKDKTIIDNLYMKCLTSAEAEEGFRKAGPPQVRRYVLPLEIDSKKSSTATENLVSLDGVSAKCTLNDKSVYCEPEILANVGMEFPQIHYNKYNGRKYRYMYGVGFHSTGHPSQTLVKIDADKKEHKEWKEMHCFPSEPVFIPHPHSKAEDDGVVVAAINRAGVEDAPNSCFVLFLDASTMTEMARVEFDGIDRFPRDLHGSYKSSVEAAV